MSNQPNTPQNPTQNQTGRKPNPENVTPQNFDRFMAGLRTNLTFATDLDAYLKQEADNRRALETQVDELTSANFELKGRLSTANGEIDDLKAKLKTAEALAQTRLEAIEKSQIPLNAVNPPKTPAAPAQPPTTPAPQTPVPPAGPAPQDPPQVTTPCGTCGKDPCECNQSVI